MDPKGPIARRFPLVARFRPACLPLPARVGSLSEFADRAVEQADQGLASTVFNQAALLASDLGLPELARSMCYRHAAAYLGTCPLPAMSAIRGLEPLVNLARLQIRAGANDDGRKRLLDLYEAVGAGNSAVFEGITVPAELTATADDRREVRAWLWRVVIADGTRTLTATGRWAEALAHLEQHKGVGLRMLDGRQVAVMTALTQGDRDKAVALLAGTTPGEPWEQEVTDCLGLLAHPDAGRCNDTGATELVKRYVSREPGPGLTVFDTRLGLTILDTVGPQSSDARKLVDELTRRVLDAKHGYSARDLLSHTLFSTLATPTESRTCSDLVWLCGLQTGVLPGELADSLSSALDRSEVVLIRSNTPERSQSPLPRP
ncbi:hypothetical protein SRB5_15710 [Streptomyces sp. RB5]|uniref:Uncharacterized protein n=1 Tax=Streptomyces smaragdinus TaxID=2585196 RepID=A0A7K0CDM5_9ACTN|nr:hypothetical protein [Streptomyces smaragdinus]MQY11453.1 hypothetical protein [Streptomyces smaragdinus]